MGFLRFETNGYSRHGEFSEGASEVLANADKIVMIHEKADGATVSLSDGLDYATDVPVEKLREGWTRALEELTPGFLECGPSVFGFSHIVSLKRDAEYPDRTRIQLDPSLPDRTHNGLIHMDFGSLTGQVAQKSLVVNADKPGLSPPPRTAVHPKRGL